MRTWKALIVLSIGIAMLALEVSLIEGIVSGGDWTVSSGIFSVNFSGLVALFLPIVAVALIGAAIDGFFTDREYAPMGGLSLRWRAFKWWRSVNDQEDASDETDDESD